MMESRQLAAWASLGLDRRTTERRAFRAPALLKLPSQQVLEVRTFDISVGGIGLVVPLNLRRDSVCDVRVRAPVQAEGMEVIMARGRIAHSILSGKEKGFLIGLEFVTLSDPLLSLIKQYVGTANA
jgi:c-di-GMP-binding flagellar brake protein YcgR